MYNNSVEGDIFSQPINLANNWLTQKSIETWHSKRPTDSKLSGDEYRRVWKKLNGE